MHAESENINRRPNGLEKQHEPQRSSITWPANLRRLPMTVIGRRQWPLNPPIDEHKAWKHTQVIDNSETFSLLLKVDSCNNTLRGSCPSSSDPDAVTKLHITLEEILTSVLLMFLFLSPIGWSPTR